MSLIIMDHAQQCFAIPPSQHLVSAAVVLVTHSYRSIRRGRTTPSHCPQQEYYGWSEQLCLLSLQYLSTKTLFSAQGKLVLFSSRDVKLFQVMTACLVENVAIE